MWFDRAGDLHIAELSSGTVRGAITPDELYDYDGVSIAEAVDCVELHIKSDYSDSVDETVTAGSGKTSRASAIRAWPQKTINASLRGCWHSTTAAKSIA